MKDWRPHIDLARLSAALADEILAAPDEDVRAAAAGSGHGFKTAQEVRKLIDAASSEQGEGDLEPLLAGRVYFRAPCARQH